MKLQTRISYDRIVITEPKIQDVYVIVKNQETNKFYIFSHNGYNTCAIVEFIELDKAIQQVKKLIKNYFLDRGEENPKDF